MVETVFKVSTWLCAATIWTGCSSRSSSVARTTSDDFRDADAQAESTSRPNDNVDDPVIDAGRTDDASEASLPDAASTSGDEPPGYPPSYPCSGVCSGEGTEPRPVPGPPPTCPDEQPRLEDECEHEGLTCSYGDASDLYCRSAFQCVSKAWVIPEPKVVFDGVCEAPPPTWCPSEQMAGEQCDVIGATNPSCEYGEGPELVRCYCQAFSSGTSVGAWFCYGPPADTRCPAEVPQLGSSCSAQGVECTYAPLDCTRHPHSSVFCFDGQWEVGVGPGCAG